MSDFIATLAPYRKAVAAFIVGVLQIVALVVALHSDGGYNAADQGAIIAAIIVALGGTGAVYAAPNTKVK